MEFAEKARENLEAVERLLPDDDGVRDCLANAVASRAYYAAYLALAHVAQEKRLPFTSTKGDYYQHDTFPDDAARYRLIDDEGRRDLAYLRGMRVKADYSEDPVEHDEASESAEVASAFVKGLIG